MRLLEELAMPHAVARNRVVFGPHETNLGRRRGFTGRHVAYYRRRASGGAGVIVTETASVHPSDWPYERAPLATASTEGWASVAQACHDEGALVLASLGHAGSQGSSAYNQLPLWAPSRVPDVDTREVPKSMEAEDIAAVVEGFAEATRLAVDAGLDGVELNAGQHSLVRQFLSGLTNQRTDAYGEDRLRLAREILRRMREAKAETVIGLRLSCDELAPWAGITPDTAVEILDDLCAYVDYVVVVRGSIYTVSATRPDGHTPAGFNLDLTRKVRDAAPRTVAVVAQGSIVDVDMAEEAVASGATDGVEMTRAQIADPDLAAKLQAGVPAQIRPCVLCNQTCQVRDARNPVVSCIGEPASGHETEDEPVSGRATSPQRFLVVGAGPAGLEAARVAASRGHDVRVIERAARTCGVLRTAAAGPGRERLAQLADWLERECVRLGVDIELGTEVRESELDRHDGPVVVATGGRDGHRQYAVDDDAQVRTARDVLGNGSAPTGPVVVWDPIGGPIGVSVAELLAPHGTVGLVTHDLIVGTQLSRSGDLADASTRLQQAGVTLHKRSRLRRVTPTEVIVEDVFTGETREIPAALVVDSGSRLPDDTLQADRPALVRAGDTVAPRTVYEAILEGRRAALTLEAGAP